MNLAQWCVNVTDKENTMPDTFALKIELGNDAMQTPDQIAMALKAVAEKLTDRGDFDGPEGAPIRDYNGNTVGEWEAS